MNISETGAVALDVRGKGMFFPSHDRHERTEREVLRVSDVRVQEMKCDMPKSGAGVTTNVII